MFLDSRTSRISITFNHSCHLSSRKLSINVYTNTVFNFILPLSSSLFPVFLILSFYCHFFTLKTIIGWNKISILSSRSVLNSPVNKQEGKLLVPHEIWSQWLTEKAKLLCCISYWLAAHRIVRNGSIKPHLVLPWRPTGVANISQDCKCLSC